MSHVAGYCIGLDMTVRGAEDRSFRKSPDSYAVLGPWLVTADEIPDPHDLALSLWVNGERRQHTSTGAMTVDIPDLIAIARTPWKPKSAFQDSLTCLNYGYPYRAHPCNDCHLLDFVSPEHKGAEVPCHFIPLNADGGTIEDLEDVDNEAKLERKVRDWLRARITILRRNVRHRQSQDALEQKLK